MPLDKYDQICTVVQQPPGDRGAVSAPGDVVVDEAPFSLEFFEHEFGHLLGYEHAFGLAGDGTWQAYLDDFDVMGYSKDNDRDIPVGTGMAALPLPAGVNFWRSGRRLSAASLYRYIAAFSGSPSVVRVPAGGARSVRLVALSKGRFGDPVLAVIGTTIGEVCIEYRIQEGDDFGVAQAPALVLHSIGRRPLPPGAHEVNPVVFEAQVPASIGMSLATTEGDVRALVTGDGAGAETITLTVTA